MSEITIGVGTQVTLHFSLALENGDEIDSNFDRDPAQFTVGDGSLLPGFEQALFGLLKGADASFVIPPEKGFGVWNENNIQKMSVDSFSDIEIAEGTVISFKEPSGAELPGVIREIDDGQVTVDFNHPLASKAITFKVNIIDVQPAVKH